MIDYSYTVFLDKFKEHYPETYIKVIEFPDAVIIGWINGIQDNMDMIQLKDIDKVKEYFEFKVKMFSNILHH
jgi:hypothetical protein